MNILKKLFTRKKIQRVFTGQRWCLNHSDDMDDITHIWVIDDVAGNDVTLTEHTSWRTRDPDRDMSGYHKVTMTFGMEEVEEVIDKQGFILLTAD